MLYSTQWCIVPHAWSQAGMPRSPLPTSGCRCPLIAGGRCCLVGIPSACWCPLPTGGCQSPMSLMPTDAHFCLLVAACPIVLACHWPLVPTRAQCLPVPTAGCQCPVPFSWCQCPPVPNAWCPRIPGAHCLLVAAGACYCPQYA